VKNLTSFKILTLMILAVGSSQVFGRELSKKENLAFQRQTIRAELSANNIEDETDGIMKILAQLHPGILEKIVKEERNLDANYSDIKRFLRDLNEEIETLSEQKNIKDTKIARLAVELADAQAMFEKYVARERSRDKRNDSHEQKIKDLLVSAQKSLKAINQKAMKSLNVFGRTVKKSAGKGMKKLPKINRLAKAGPVEEVVVQSSGQQGPSGQLLSKLRGRMGSSN